MKSAKLFYILGAMRDGSLPKCGSKKEVSLASDVEKSWLEMIARMASEEFSIPYSRFKVYEVWDVKSKQPCFRLKIYSKQVYELLSKYYEPGDQLSWNTPNAVRRASTNAQLEYVAGFFDAEGGCRRVDRFQSNITRTMNCWLSIFCRHAGANEPLWFIRKVLMKVGVVSHIYDNDELVVTGKRNVARFYERVPSRHPKRERLKKLLSFYGALPANA